MMIDPPIDKLLEKAECKYALVCLIAKRARFLLDKKSDMLAETGARAVSVAAHEIYDGDVIAGRGE
jgi:DNA-directed RNA polymerase omega subunit